MDAKSFYDKFDEDLGRVLEERRKKNGLSRNALINLFESYYQTNGVKTDNGTLAESTIKRYEYGEMRIPAFYFFFFNEIMEKYENEQIR